MPCRLLVKNISNSWVTGDVIAVVDGDHAFGKYESKEQFIKAGLNPDDWPRQFVIVNITDVDKSYYEYLLEEKKNEKRRYFITPQLNNSPYYSELLQNAEITTTSATLDPLIKDKGV